LHTLLQVHDEYLAKQAEFRAAAAHLAAVREERLREEAARAQQSEAVARQERLAAEAAAAQVGLPMCACRVLGEVRAGLM
jgi:hypothetical protein